jgi:hypothetical protein
MTRFVVLVVLALGPTAAAQPPAPPTEGTPPAEPPPPTAEPERAAAEEMFETRFSGYIHSYWEQPTFVPYPVGYDRTGMEVIKERDPSEFDVLDFNVMVQGTIRNRFRYLVNLASPQSGSVIDDEPVVLRNAWVEAALMGERLRVRAGKLYRRFGLYNEILDAVPTYIGIEAPELLDRDHPMLTRTTNLMLHGSHVTGDLELAYALTTGNDERIRYPDGDTTVPLGADVNLTHEKMLKVGISYYDTIGEAVPSVGVGEGPPKGGVAPWMVSDKYRVIDAYAEYRNGPLIAQVEYCIALHDARRDASAILALGDASSGLSPIQYGRFFRDNFDDVSPTESDVIEEATYNVQTAYFRVGYAVMAGKLTPYVQGDFYRNPEIIGQKDYGGDNEAGWDDDGQFVKATFGALYRPISPVALKADFSIHSQSFGGESYRYPELRVSFAYSWDVSP